MAVQCSEARAAPFHGSTTPPGGTGPPFTATATAGADAEARAASPEKRRRMAEKAVGHGPRTRIRGGGLAAAPTAPSAAARFCLASHSSICIFLLAGFRFEFDFGSFVLRCRRLSAVSYTAAPNLTKKVGFSFFFFIFFEKSLILFWGFWNRFFVWSVKWWVLVFKA